jgi:hypothetical protein
VPAGEQQWTARAQNHRQRIMPGWPVTHPESTTAYNSTERMQQQHLCQPSKQLQIVQKQPAPVFAALHGSLCLQDTSFYQSSNQRPNSLLEYCLLQAT